MEDDYLADVEIRLGEIAQELQELAENADNPTVEASLEHTGGLIETLAEQERHYD